MADARKTTSDSYRPRPELKGKDPLLYQTVAARRLQFDNLAWQVPVISLTGQAFLFTIALSGDNSTLARAIASGLACVAALLSMALISRHRSAEITDADWLRAYETANFHATFTGEVWQDERNRVARAQRNPVARAFSQVPGYTAWMWGFGGFALAALATLVLALADSNGLNPSATASARKTSHHRVSRGVATTTTQPIPPSGP